MNIIDKAKELGEMIVASEEMTHLKKCEEIVQNDDRARTILNDLDLLQKELIRSYEEKRDESIAENIKERISSKLKEANSNEKISNYFNAGSAFNRLMKSVNDTINYTITGEVSCSSGGCSSCSGCGGCK